MFNYELVLSMIIVPIPTHIHWRLYRLSTIQTMTMPILTCIYMYWHLSGLWTNQELLGGLEHDFYDFPLGMSSSQLSKSIIFRRAWNCKNLLDISWYAHPQRRVQLPFKASSTNVIFVHLKGCAHHLSQKAPTVGCHGMRPAPAPPVTH